MGSEGTVTRLRQRLHACREEGRLALLLYLTVGFPSVAATVEMGQALMELGVDGIELGIPFSDPLADGPTIQAAASVALGNGVTTEVCLQVATALRQHDRRIPLLFMGYFNPMLQYGPMPFVRASVQAGVDGLIVPDLPLEEAEELDGPCREAGLGVVPLVAPTTPPARIRLQDRRATGFLYVVTRQGVTGAREPLPEDVPDLVRRVRRESGSPLALGFGIGHAAQVRALRGLADAAIVGSALIARIASSDGSVQEVRRFARDLLEGTYPG
ncbi:MAG: tryptophan synthase subunit alpha [Anaerolineae bacterium]|nr:tryptophan synthase subunit alpha [Anaerolineae bacterium]